MTATLQRRAAAVVPPTSPITVKYLQRATDRVQRPRAALEEPEGRPRGRRRVRQGAGVVSFARAEGRGDRRPDVDAQKF